MYNKQTATCWCGAGINRRARPRDCRPAGHLLLRYLLRPAVPYVLGDRRCHAVPGYRAAQSSCSADGSLSVSLSFPRRRSSVIRSCTPAVRGLERGEKSYSCRAACMRCFGFSLSCFVLCVYVTLGRRRGRDRARAIRSIGLVLVAAMRCVWPRASDIYQHESTLDACQSAAPSSPFWLIPTRPHRAATIILSELSFESLRAANNLHYCSSAHACMAN